VAVPSAQLSAARRAGSRSGTTVSVCGEMASDPALLAVLLGLGLTSFSMTPRAIAAARHLVSSVSVAELRSAMRRVEAIGTLREVEALLERVAKTEARSSS